MYNFLIDIFGSPVIAFFVAAALPLFLFILPYALIAVLAERKVSAHMQDRLGPMRTGYHGIFQTVADILKLIQKEDITANSIDRTLFNFAPYLVFIGSFAAFAVLPFSSFFVGSSIDIGLFYFLAISSLVVAGILMGGWSSNNKYSLLGAMRSVSQIISYEIPTAIVVLTMVMLTSTLNLDTITNQQTAYFWNWNILGGAATGIAKFLLIPLMFAAFIIIFISTLAEVNRTPFDIPEAESELVSGFFTEYTGMKFAMFFLAEYANMLAVSFLITVLFFGGYHSPFGYLGNSLGIEWLVPIEQGVWFATKGLTFVLVQMWLRWTLPRLRVDQLMTVCWKYLIPYSVAILLLVGFITLI
ncbi:MAG: NADH-quinone oxidoreductase subunit NuoH [Ignavibacteriales bacterium]|nr:NADH-quinone oxidoreductase subunit NuoH [Ignavibacteriota bacterium]MCB9250254.1 NADH-quinone oxidoreductase subunit NuoH [Ignavibacteriales bacterium]